MKRLQEILKQPLPKNEMLSRNAVLVQRRLQQLQSDYEEAEAADAKDAGKKEDAYYNYLDSLLTVSGIGEDIDVDQLIAKYDKVLRKLGYDTFVDPRANDLVIVKK